MALIPQKGAPALQQPVPSQKGGQAPPPQAIPSKPTVSGFRVSGRRKRSSEEIAKKLAELSFLEMSLDGENLQVLNVESRDIQKNPYLFSIVTFGSSSVEVTYTCMPTMSPKKRRIDVLRHFLNLLTITDDCYEVDIHELYQLLEAAVANMTEYVSADFDRLFSVYDNLKTELTTQQKKNKELLEANSTLSKENYDLKSKNDELVLKLQKLETYSDSVLALKVQEWLSEHKGEINISEFSKVYGVPETRVEQMLNKLVTEGYIETKG